MKGTEAKNIVLVIHTDCCKNDTNSCSIMLWVNQY